MSSVVGISEVEILFNMDGGYCDCCSSKSFLVSQHAFNKNQKELEKLPHGSVEIVGEIYSDLNSDGTCSIERQCQVCLNKGIQMRMWTHTPSKYT
jgi:hypothetical protein